MDAPPRWFSAIHQFLVPRQLFDRLCSQRLAPTTVTYNALINAHVRRMTGRLGFEKGKVLGEICKDSDVQSFASKFICLLKPKYSTELERIRCTLEWAESTTEWSCVMLPACGSSTHTPRWRQKETDLWFANSHKSQDYLCIYHREIIHIFSFSDEIVDIDVLVSSGQISVFLTRALHAWWFWRARMMNSCESGIFHSFKFDLCRASFDVDIVWW